MNQRIEFEFCGGCILLYDRKRIYNIISRISTDEESVNISFEKRILIILNGCQRGCIDPEKFREKFDEIIDTQSYLASCYSKDSGAILHWIKKGLKSMSINLPEVCSDEKD